jgi:hypothetical protein
MKTRTKIIWAAAGLISFLLIVLAVSARYYRSAVEDSTLDVLFPGGRVVDRALKQMPLGSIAFNAPESMNFYDTAAIELKLGLTSDIDYLKGQIEAAGRQHGARIRISDRMEANLIGSNFDVTAITPALQAVSQTEVTEWKWEVKPTSAGVQDLHLTISALLDVDGAATPRVIRTFHKTIAVDITWGQRASVFFGKSWQWLWAAILVPIVGWVWRKRKEAKVPSQRWGIRMRKRRDS